MRLELANKVDIVVHHLLDWNEAKPIGEYVPAPVGTGSKYHWNGADASNKIEALYAFWLKNEDGYLNGLNRKLVVQGSKLDGVEHRIHKLEWELGESGAPVLVYVGKTTNLQLRLSNHLKLGTDRSDWRMKAEKKRQSKHGENQDFLIKIDTASQLRAGIEHLLRDHPEVDIWDFLRERLLFRFVLEKDFQVRFYAEDLAIGQGMPWLNVDSER